MPRDGSGIYHRPVGTDAVTDTTIESTKYNINVQDVEQDLNTPRPIVAGGTGSSSASGAMTALGGELANQVITNYDSDPIVSGSFKSAVGATSAPNSAHAFAGIAYGQDASNRVQEARDLTDGTIYARRMTAGVWSAWAIDGARPFISDTPPASAPDNSIWWESDTGLAFIKYNDGDSSQWVLLMPVPDTSLLVQKAGDTMTGPLVLPADPTANLQAATKQYVDNHAPLAGSVRYDTAQALTAAQQVQARQNVYAAPFDALAYNGLQLNGSFEVSQELGATAVTFGGIPKYIVDGWQCHSSGAQNMSAKQRSPSEGAAYAVPGYNNCLHMFNSVANPSPAAGEFCACYHFIEGYRIVRLAWGTLNAQPISIGFWVNANRPGTYSGSVRNGTAATRSYAFNFTINAAQTWEWKTITIPGDTGGTWKSDNNLGIELTIAMMVGTTYATAPGVWTNGNFLGATGSFNGVGVANDAMMLAGVVILPGIELPSTARAPLIIRPFDQELLICQRYLARWPLPQYVRFALAYADQTTTCQTAVPLSTPLRAAPAMTQANMTVQNAALTAIGIIGLTSNLMSLQFTVASGLTIAGMYQVYSNVAGGGYVQADARL